MSTAPSVPPTRSCLPPTLVGTCHTCFFEENQVHDYMYARIKSFIHIVTYNWIQKQYHVGKREIIRYLRLIPWNEASKHPRAVDWGLCTPSTSNIFIAASSFWATLFIERVSTCRTQQVWGKYECKGLSKERLIGWLH
jgi:hypothetical protein